jgi:signal peptidase
MNGDREDSFAAGDLIYVRILNDKTREELKVGDIVTFYDYDLRFLNTHRIVEINETSTGKSVITQGDKAGAPRDPARPIEDILAIHTSTKKGGGAFILFIQSKLGFGLLIVLPVFILFVVQGVRFYLIIKGNKQAVDLEAEREKIRAELLQEMAEKEKNADE